MANQFNTPMVPATGTRLVSITTVNDNVSMKKYIGGDHVSSYEVPIDTDMNIAVKSIINYRDDEVKLAR